MPALIGACDVVVTNAGGITALESIACEVPVVAYRPLPGHGVTNADALRASGLGVSANDATQLAKRLADPWPLPFDALAVSRPADIFAYPDPADTILSQLRPGPLESEAAEPALSVMR
jgi:UDP-N-acetylglucosamine:LPS N-acetylglucosamine transferase